MDHSVKAISEAGSLPKRKRLEDPNFSRASKRRRRHSHKDKGPAPSGGKTTANSIADGKAHSLLPLGANGKIFAGSHLVKKASHGRSRQAGTAPWAVSAPMGGRMVDIDPIFSSDEKYLLVTYHDSFQVYSTADSLLVRRISLPLRAKGRLHNQHAYIAAVSASKASVDLVWVGCSDGRIWRLDWTAGSIEELKTRNGSQLTSMAVETITVAGVPQEVLFTSERVGDGSEVLAYLPTNLAEPDVRSVYTHTSQIQRFQAASGGRTLVATSGKTIIIGERKRAGVGAFEDIKYRFVCFDISDEISALDVRSSPRKPLKTQDPGQESSSLPLIDLAIGCVHGSILIYGDILGGVRGIEAKGSQIPPIQPRKNHWHRKAVHCVKWSRDGNYFLSGGSETVLVLWQTDTGKRDYLPHLGASVENIVVSPQGSSYAVRLDDNSTMVLSTAEMKPTCYVSGLQSFTFGDRPRKDDDRQLWKLREGISQPLTAAISPTDPSRLLLAVGGGRRGFLAGVSPSTALLQSFDLSVFQSIAKQPLARTHPTDVNQALDDSPITEPTVTHLCVSHDGRWMASVDEWQPPARDYREIEGIVSSEDWACGRREIHLKFWECPADDGAFELVSRINEAHMTKQAERIFSMVADKRSSRFVTLGDDSMVRFWRPTTRQADGVASTGADGRPLVSWACVQSVSLGRSFATVTNDMPLGSLAAGNRSGSLAFSEDGSTLFAAFSNQDEGVLYVVDAETGEVRDELHSLFSGELRGIACLSSYVILLTADLTVYDVVADELQYGYQLRHKTGSGGSRMAQLAVNELSGTFAVAVPLQGTHYGKSRKGHTSEVAVFSPGQSQPLLLKSFNHLVISLLPAVGSGGFLVVDAAAQVWSLSEETEPAPLVQPLAELSLDTSDEMETPMANGTVALALSGGDASEDEQEEVDDEASDYDVHAAVIAPQHLADIFNTAPAYAMPPIEDVFYQVAALLSTNLPSTTVR